MSEPREPCDAIVDTRLPPEAVPGAKAMLEAMPGFAMLVTDDHRIVEANAAVRSAVAPGARVEGAYCPRLVHGVDGPFPGCPLERACLEGCPIETDIQDPATGRWMTTGAYPTSLLTQDGRRVYLHAASDATTRKQADQDIARNIERQAAIAAVLRLTLSEAPIEAVLAEVLRMLLGFGWLSLEGRGAVFVVEPHSGVLEMKASNGLAAPIQESCRRVPPGTCMCGRAAAAGRILFADRVDERHDITYEGMLPHGHYCVPVTVRGSTTALINLYVREGHVRDPAEEEFLEAVANALSAGFERRGREDDLRRSLDKINRTMAGVIEMVTRVVEARDPYTAGHQRRVAVLSAAVAAELGYEADRVEGLRAAARIHDLGKIAVPAELLTKPTRLTPTEFALIQAHVEAGFDIVKDIEFAWPVALMIVQHHERMDGSGYPRGTRGDDILPESRILAVADVVEAMASHRPYRPALGLDQAIGEIVRGRGTAFDADVVDACARVAGRPGFSLN
jgi:HD-GYP domain-containing protein (c-di-GMP phosphodiesterase class II)